jgi:hypothetical protein
VSGEAANFRGIRDEPFRVNLAFLYKLNKALVRVASLAIVGIRMGGVADRSMTRGQILGADPSDRIFGFAAVAIDTAFVKRYLPRCGDGGQQNGHNKE